MNFASEDDVAIKKRCLEERKQKARRVLRQYEGFVPVYVQKSPKARIPNVFRNQYLVATNATIGMFLYKLRKEISLRPEDGLFVVIGNCIPSNSALIGDLYRNYHKEDLHLHLTYTNENVFG